MLVSAVQQLESLAFLAIFPASRPPLHLIPPPPVITGLRAELSLGCELPPPAAHFAQAPWTNASAPLSLCPAAFLHSSTSLVSQSVSVLALRIGTITVLLTPYVGITIRYLPFSS